MFGQIFESRVLMAEEKAFETYKENVVGNIFGDVCGQRSI